MELIFSDAESKYNDTIARDVRTVREAATIARQRLAQYGTPYRDHNCPGGDIAAWAVRGTDRYGVHAVES